jgi:hypothetical protein
LSYEKPANSKVFSKLFESVFCGQGNYKSGSFMALVIAKKYQLHSGGIRLRPFQGSCEDLFQWLENKLIQPIGFFVSSLGEDIDLQPVITRSNAPFQPLPAPHQKREVHLNQNVTNLIQEIREDITDQSKDRSTCQVLCLIISFSHCPQKLESLVANNQKVLGDLPGGVHNCTPSTVLAMVRNLEMDPRTTIFGDFGCGAPIFGMQASIFSKEALCLDLVPVMNQILRIMNFMAWENDIIQTLHLVGADIMSLNISAFPPVCKKMTHLVCLIGIPEG